MNFLYLTFLGLSFIYFGFFLVLLEAFQLDGRIVYNIPTSLEEPFIHAINFSLWLLFFMIFGRKTYFRNIRKCEKKSIKGIYFAGTVVTAACLIYLATTSLELLNLNYDTAFGFFYKNSGKAFTLTVIYLTSTIICCYSLAQKRICFAILFSLPLFFGLLFLKNKDCMVLLITSIVYGSSIAEKNLSFAKIILLSIISIILLSFVLQLSFFRATGEFNFSQISYSMPFLYTDGSGPYSTFVFVANHPNHFEYHTPFFGGFTNLIPKFLYYDRPFSISESFARFIIPQYKDGMGVGFSPMAESILIFGKNFWFLGILLFLACWGVMNFIFYNIIKSLDFFGDTLDRLYFLFFPYLLILMFRGGLTSYLKTALFVFIVLLVIGFLVKFYSLVSQLISQTIKPS